MHRYGIVRILFICIFTFHFANCSVTNNTDQNTNSKQNNITNNNLNNIQILNNDYQEDQNSNINNSENSLQDNNLENSSINSNSNSNNNSNNFIENSENNVNAPEFEQIGNYIIEYNSQLTFRVMVSDPNNDLLQIFVGVLPDNAEFNNLTGVFSWIPNQNQIGQHTILFTATDGEHTVFEITIISVIEPGSTDNNNNNNNNENNNDNNNNDNNDTLDCGSNEECVNICCEEDEICFSERCTVPGIDCTSSIHCPIDEYCEPILGKCLSSEDIINNCEYRPPAGEFTPVLECKWDGSSTTSNRDDVVMTPVVANVTDDNNDGIIDTSDVPDILFLSYDLQGVGCCNAPSTLRVVSGKCGADGKLIEHFSITSPNMDNSAGIAVGDLEGDGFPDIVTMKKGSGTVAFENDGTLKWESIHPKGDDILTAVQPAIVNLDKTGSAEVVVGRVVLNGETGELIWKGTAGRGINAFLGPISIVADINMDGNNEVIAGNTVYDYQGNELWTYTYGNEGTGCSGSKPCDGYNAVGNFDDDDEGEIVVVREGVVYILEHTGELQFMVTIPKKDCGKNEGGPPTVADFDGDLKPEIGVAGANYYIVADPDCKAPLPPECHSEGILWAVPNHDCSSRATGSSVFDFEADGKAEVIYNDEKHFRILNGSDGAELFKWSNQSHTRMEYPIIVDVDNDGNAEVVFIENGGTDHGIEVWGDSSDNWVSTRRIWNQHAYHVTNINEDGSVPLSEEPNWLSPRLNNYRQNVQFDGIFNAPDLIAEYLTGDLSECIEQKLILLANIKNIGSRGIAAGLPVSFYKGEENGTSEYLGTVYTSTALLPGSSEEVSITIELNLIELGEYFNFFVRADDNGTGSGIHNECDEDNNTAKAVELGCGLDCPEGVTTMSEEICDGIDNDCDSETDEDLTRACSTECGAGTETCNLGSWVDCSAPAPQEEICNGLDDDCDGQVDEELINKCGTCGPDLEEVCDGIDNDCDGNTDNGDLCSEDSICYCGGCSEQCFRSECNTGIECVEGYCLQNMCPDFSICTDNGLCVSLN